MAGPSTRKRAKWEITKACGHLDSVGSSLAVLEGIYAVPHPELGKGFASVKEMISFAYTLLGRLDDTI